MKAYVVRRFASLVPLLVGLSILSFGLGQAAPGDPARSLLRQAGGAPPTEEEVRTFRQEMGLDDPAVVQYVRWVRNATSGDLGKSIRSGEAVTRSLKRAFPITLRLAALTFLVVLAVAVPLGTTSALRKGGVVDHAVRILSVAGASLPTFWFGYLLIILFSVRWHLLPTSGVASPSAYVLPALTLALPTASVLLRLTRGAMLEVLGEQFVLAAHSRGLPPARVHLRHALRVALNPVVTYSGLLVGGLLAGAVIVETVFAVPGVGKLVVDAINARDFAVVQGFVLLFGAFVLLLNLAVDLLYVVLDPRVLLDATDGAP